MDKVAILRRLMQVALPILLSSLVSLFAPFINASIIGWDYAPNLYVLAIFLPISFLQVSINESLRVSSIVFSSRAAGSGNMQTLNRRLQSLLALGVLIYLILAFVFWLSHDQFMALYAVPVARQVITYRFIQLNILVGALVVVSISMMSSLYGIGQVYQVTLVTIIGFAANVLLTLLFVSWNHWGLYALPVSTLITASATITWAAFKLARLGVLSLPGKDGLRPYWGHWHEIYSISMPVFGGYLILFVNSLLFNRLLTQFSPADIAGFGVAYRIQNIVLMPAIAIGIGLAINVNRMVAAQEQVHVYRFMSTTLWTSFAIFVGLAGLVFVGREFLLRLVTDDGAVVSAGSHYLSYMGPAYILVGPLLTLLIFLEESGNGIRSLIFNACMFAVQLGLAFYLAQTYHSVDLVYLVIALSYLVAALYILYEMARYRRLFGQQISMIKGRDAMTVALKRFPRAGKKRLKIWIDADLSDKLAAAGKRNDCSVTSIVEELIALHVDKQQTEAMELQSLSFFRGMLERVLEEKLLQLKLDLQAGMGRALLEEMRLSLHLSDERLASVLGEELQAVNTDVKKLGVQIQHGEERICSNIGRVFDVGGMSYHLLYEYFKETVKDKQLLAAIHECAEVETGRAQTKQSKAAASCDVTDKLVLPQSR